MESLVTFVEIMFINMLLSGDNAVVIALASQQLPQEQRRKAIWWGAALAVALRCVLTLVAITLLKVPYLQAGGAVLLFIIAIKLIADAADGQQSHDVRKAKSLGQAIRTIIAADFIMSLDNVLAIAAIADGEPVLILLGIAISIPMIIWGSQLLSRILQKFPPLVYIGGGLLGYAAGEMLAHDPGIMKLLTHHSNVFQEAVPLLSVPFVIAVALLRLRR
ncbi:TerC family protein [Paenibacillus spongiae]|uniref:TerC family protein n=1 Tax=Paenibacillus spongiae TaxID=2909671 RepID=A0ABY5SDX6_9BACL|nr:TerC family protein [Paenibacillus spongiae]UVI32166.1 TerC family protein [Paenibacillus spongiae]